MLHIRFVHVEDNIWGKSKFEVLFVKLKYARYYLYRIWVWDNHSVVKKSNEKLMNSSLSHINHTTKQYHYQNTLDDSHHWFRQQAITRASVDPYPCRQVASLGHNELINMAFFQDS